MKNFQEKEVKDLSVVTGGVSKGTKGSFECSGWFNGVKGDEVFLLDYVGATE